MYGEKSGKTRKIQGTESELVAFLLKRVLLSGLVVSVGNNYKKYHPGQVIIQTWTGEMYCSDGLLYRGIIEIQGDDPGGKFQRYDGFRSRPYIGGTGCSGIG